MEGTIKREKTRAQRDEAQLLAASIVADWFVPYMYGVDIEVSDVPVVMRARISDFVGVRPTIEQLTLVRTLINDLPVEHTNNAVLYCVGYPSSALSVLSEGDIEVTIDLLMAAGEVHRDNLPATLTLKATPRVGMLGEGGIELLAEPNRTEQETSLARASIIRSVMSADNNDDLNSRYADAVDISWQDDALCAQTDPEAFFPEKGGSTRDAKKICSTCEVTSSCLDYALMYDERFGVWGGLSERQRRSLKRER